MLIPDINQKLTQLINKLAAEELFEEIYPAANPLELPGNLSEARKIQLIKDKAEDCDG